MPLITPIVRSKYVWERIMKKAFFFAAGNQIVKKRGLYAFCVSFVALHISQPKDNAFFIATNWVAFAIVTDIIYYTLSRVIYCIPGSIASSTIYTASAVRLEWKNWQTFPRIITFHCLIGRMMNCCTFETMSSSIQIISSPHWFQFGHFWQIACSTWPRGIMQLAQIRGLLLLSSW